MNDIVAMANEGEEEELSETRSRGGRRRFLCASQEGGEEWVGAAGVI